MQSRSDRCYEHAVRCEKYAKLESHAWLRDEFIRMAEQWRKIAEEAELVEKRQLANSDT